MGTEDKKLVRFDRLREFLPHDFFFLFFPHLLAFVFYAVGVEVELGGYRE